MLRWLSIVWRCAADPRRQRFMGRAKIERAAHIRERDGRRERAKVAGSEQLKRRDWQTEELLRIVCFALFLSASHSVMYGHASFVRVFKYSVHQSLR